MRKIIPILISILILTPITLVFSTTTESIEYELITTASHIVDGDTFYSDFSRFRLADIDSPDSGDPGYSEAKTYITNLIFEETVWIDVDDMGSTSWNRLICVVYVKHNETHFVNVNQMIITSGHAWIDDHTNNEFDPSLWTDYVEIECLLSSYSYLFEYETVNTIFPSNCEPKPLGCGKAMETDWLASAFITSTLNDYSEGLDTEASFVNQSTGKAMGDYGWGIVSFGGPFVNPVVKRAENESTPIEDRAPVKFYDEGGYAKFKHWNGDTISGAMLPWSNVNNDKDMFVIEVFRDGDGRNILLCYGFGWKGTYASGKYFDTVIYPDLESYPYSWIIVKWEDTNGDGFVNTQEGGDSYTLIASG